MTPPLKLFFDECCSKRLARKIVDIYNECYSELATKHLSDFCSTGTDDPDWIPNLLEKEKDWIVLTADRGKDPKKQKLPIICQKFGVTHICLTPSLANAGYRAHKQALLSVWPQILRAPLLPKGTKVSLGYRMFNNGLTKFPYIAIENKAFDVWCNEKGIPN